MMADLTGLCLSGQYTLEQKIGSGGMSDVYKAWDSARSNYMAVKVLHTKLATSRKTLDMFESEAKFLKELEHPNIARLYEFRNDREFYFLVLEWIDGQSLDKIIRTQRTPLSLEDVSNILEPVASALHYLHINNVLHSDIKPGNILVARNNRIFLSDLGVAKFMSSDSRGGTPPYMAPEQFESTTVDRRTDVYALGVTVFELLSGGILPFQGDSPQSKGASTKERIAWEHLNLPVPSICRLNPKVPQAINDVLGIALAKSPGNRYDSAFAFFNAFQAALSGFDAPTTNERESILHTSFTTTPYNGESSRERINSGRESEQGPINKPKGDIDSKYKRENRFVGLYGKWRNRVILIVHPETTFGRSSAMQVQFFDRSVSRSHATVIRKNRVVYIRDNNSLAGTYVNDQRVQGIRRLNHKDVVRFGNNEILEYRDR